jgi:hypothetical protein
MKCRYTYKNKSFNTI